MGRKRLFSDELRRSIEQSELTRYEISKQTGIAQSILSRFVNQGAGLSMDSINRLCDCLELRLVADVSTKRKKGK
jgi:hypothetical protein